MKLKVSKLELYEGQRMPWGFGIAAVSVAKAEYWIAPIPLNLLIRAAINVYFWLSNPGFSDRERILMLRRLFDQMCRDYSGLLGDYERMKKKCERLEREQEAIFQRFGLK